MSDNEYSNTLKAPARYSLKIKEESFTAPTKSVGTYAKSNTNVQINAINTDYVNILCVPEGRSRGKRARGGGHNHEEGTEENSSPWYVD